MWKGTEAVLGGGAAAADEIWEQVMNSILWFNACGTRWGERGDGCLCWRVASTSETGAGASHTVWGVCQEVGRAEHRCHGLRAQLWGARASHEQVHQWGRARHGRGWSSMSRGVIGILCWQCMSMVGDRQVAYLIGGVDVSPGAQQQADHLQMAFTCCPVQGRVTILQHPCVALKHIMICHKVQHVQGRVTILCPYCVPPPSAASKFGDTVVGRCCKCGGKLAMGITTTIMCWGSAHRAHSCCKVLQVQATATIVCHQHTLALAD
jgi:hypothetical protein